MTDLRATVDHSVLDRRVQNYTRGIKRMPRGKKNPLIREMQRYRVVTLGKRYWPRRPTVGQDGVFAGVRWPKHEPAYTRADGTEIPVWGGVRRVRAGRVTRASGFGVRQGSGTTKKERAAGFGVVKKGQTFTGGNVKGKLRKDGSRYKRSDKQMGKGKGGGLLSDFITGPPFVSPSGKTVVATSNKKYASKQGDKRPWHWTPRIGKLVRARVVRSVTTYVVGLWNK